MRESPLLSAEVTRAIAHLRSCNIESAALDATLILAHCLGVRRERIYSYPMGYRVGYAVVGRYRRLIRRRGRRYPVAYIVGRREFYAHHLEVNRSTLIPRPESELLVEVCAALIAGNPWMRVLHECGVGCGAIIISITARFLGLDPPLVCSASDVSRAALRVARRNIARIAGEGAITLLHGSLVQPLRVMPHLVVANLPYLTKSERRAPDLRYEPTGALYGGRGGLKLIAGCIKESAHRLHKGGYIVLECAPHQRAEIEVLLAEAGFVGVEWHCDVAGAHRAVSARVI